MSRPAENDAGQHRAHPAEQIRYADEVTEDVVAVHADHWKELRRVSICRATMATSSHGALVSR